MLPLSGCGKDDSTESTSGEAAAPVAEGSSAQAPADTGTWSMVTLVDGSPVFGHRKDSGVEGTFALVDAFFVAGGDAADVNTLRPFGSEIHRPLQMLIIPWTSVVYEEPLAADAPAVTAIGEYDQASTRRPIPSHHRRFRASKRARTPRSSSARERSSSASSSSRARRSRSPARTSSASRTPRRMMPGRSPVSTRWSSYPSHRPRQAPLARWSSRWGRCCTSSRLRPTRRLSPP